MFLCDTPTGTKVCRFSDHEIVFRNRYVSELLALNDIPAPQTTVHAYFDCRFETYDYCPTPTLYEQIQSGMINTDVFEAYKHIIEIQRRISEIPCEHFKPHKCRYMYEIFTANQKMRVHPMLARIYGAVHRLFSDGGDIRVLHNDLYDKNILVNAQAKVDRIIDLDAVALCNESFSVMLTLRTYPLGNNLEYMEYYEDTMGRKINRSAIINGLKILNAIRKPQVALNRLLWHGYNTPPGR